MGWGLSPDGAHGWLAGCKRVGGQAQAAGQLGASGASGVVAHKTDVKGKPIQLWGRGGPSGERKAASLLENCGSSKA